MCRVLVRSSLPLLIAALVGSACGGERIVPADDGSAPGPADASPASDAGTVADDASEPPADAWAPEPGSCNPDRTPDAISHSDCRSIRDRPICDAISERCVALPEDYCGACATDAQCANFDLNSRCVFLPGQPLPTDPDVIVNADQACLAPCTGDSDCDFLRSDPDWSAVRCYALPAGSFCVPYTVVHPHCRDGSGNRI